MVKSSPCTTTLRPRVVWSKIQGDAVPRATLEAQVDRLTMAAARVGGFTEAGLIIAQMEMAQMSPSSTDMATLPRKLIGTWRIRGESQTLEGEGLLQRENERM